MEHAHIGMPIIASIYDDVIVLTVGSFIVQFSLGTKLVGITSDGGTKL